jgi:tRNA U34 5-methylaminomethyl-2-thiouridine-forming methyltransferase MnmC
MIATGLSVEKIPGPWGKREMLRAVKDEAIAGDERNATQR